MTKLEQELADIDEQIAVLESRRVRVSNQISNELRMREPVCNAVPNSVCTSNLLMFPGFRPDYQLAMDGTTCW